MISLIKKFFGKNAEEHPDVSIRIVPMSENETASGNISICVITDSHGGLACEFFRMDKECAKKEMKKICDTVSSYRSVLADKYKIPRQEQQYMNDSFSEADRPFFSEEKVLLKSDIDLKKIM